MTHRGHRGGRALVGGVLLVVAAVVGWHAMVPRGAGAPSSEVIPGLLRATWEGYKHDFIRDDGRVVDPARDDSTTSEGESYAMLRAVWMDDRGEFDRVWNWTRVHLRGAGSGPIASLWQPDSTVGHGTVVDANSASDADEDIALALVMGGHRWHDRRYLEAGLDVIREIWADDVAQVAGQPYLTAGNWAGPESDARVFLNPSYLAPYAYRVFAAVDPDHPWSMLVDTSYRALRECSRPSPESADRSGLPPDWCSLDPRSGAVISPQGGPSDVYGYDAFRVMWRVALDYRWNRSGQAKAYLEGARFLHEEWRRRGWLAAQYALDGRPLSTESPAAYAGDLGNLLVTDPAAARAVLSEKLLASYRPLGPAPYWDQRHNYYTQNWVWFGVALAGDQLTDLTGR
jgi:endo-1,4-beta-D-glucanase Y